ncbi:MAG: phosphate ABC transporter permease PstA [Rhodoluna sp.]|nr:phosphate ABC transporter permease PstA [Rhodoluna sp.]
MTDLKASVKGKTYLPVHTENGPAPVKRKLRAIRLDDVFDIVGSIASSLSLTYLLFGWLTGLQSTVGFVVVNFVLFLISYAAITALKNPREEIKDRVITVLLGSAGVILMSALLFVVVYTLGRGQLALGHLNFFTTSMEQAGPLQPLSVGGIVHAIVGTLIQITIALAVTIPLGITTAVFLNEIGGKFARFVRTIADAMTALPSIVAGLFVLSAFIRTGLVPRSGFAASLAITVMMLPIVIRASDVVLRLVANNLREASLALGATKWRTVWHIVLPTARSGLVTAVILGTARGIGETSPVLLTSGISAVMNFNPFAGPMISLPLQVFDFVKSPEPTMIARGFGTAATLLVLVLILFVLARTFGGKAPGNLSKGAQRAANRQSLADEQRIENLMAVRLASKKTQRRNIKE